VHVRQVRRGLFVVAVRQDVGLHTEAGGELVRVAGGVAGGLDGSGCFDDQFAADSEVSNDLGVVESAAGHRVVQQVGEEHTVGRRSAHAAPQQLGADGERVGVPVPRCFGDLPEVRVVQVGRAQDAAQVVADLAGGEDRAKDGAFGERVVRLVHASPRFWAQVSSPSAGTARSAAYFSALRIHVRQVATQSSCLEPLPRW
jgi:hypothetical protein